MNASKPVNLLPSIGADLEAYALECCSAAKAFEDVADFVTARERLGVFFEGSDSVITSLSSATRAEVLLRVGSLRRRIAGRNRIEDDQEKAKTELIRALEVFREAGNVERIAESLIALAGSCWYLGNRKQGRLLLGDRVFELCDSPLIHANRLYMLSIIEREEKQYVEAISLLREAVSYCEKISSLPNTCRYRGELGSSLLLLGEKENNPNHINEALFHYTIASREAEEAGNVRYAGFLWNNVGYAFYRHGRYNEAWEQLMRARAIFERIPDSSCIAAVDETRSRVLIAQKRYKEAERLLRRSVRTFETTGESAKLAEALLTLSDALKGMSREAEAEREILKAAEIYSLNEDVSGEGLAQLALAELLIETESTNLGRLLKSFVLSARLLSREEDPKITERLNRIEERALKLIEREPACRLAQPEEASAVAPAFLWDEGLTLDEAQSKVEEWYLSRLLLEQGTLSGIARALDLSVEGARLKLSKYPHLRLLYEGMRESKVLPLGRSLPADSRAALEEIQLDDEDDYLAMLGPEGGDTLAVQRAESLLPHELGVIEAGGEFAAGYLDASDGRPKLKSGHKDYPPQPLTAGKFKIVGRVMGYWKGDNTGGCPYPLMKP